MLNGHKYAIEQTIKEQLDAGDIDMLTEFADFAAGEICNYISSLLFAILQADSSRWFFMLANVRQYSPDLADAIANLENELERKRAKFIEYHAALKIKAAEAEAQARAEFQAETDAESWRLSR